MRAKLIWLSGKNGSELMRFDLLDKEGNPTEINVFRRERVV